MNKLEISTSSKQINISLIGNPNSGKTSVFNRLTGLNQRVGNFPGVTVDKKSASLHLSDGRKATLIDLPGTYSLYPTSMDERVVLDVLLDTKSKYYPEVVVCVVDATNLERHLLLLSQVKDLGIPVVLGLNMVDLADKNGVEVDLAFLQKSLQVPVVKINGRTGKGISELLDKVEDVLYQPSQEFMPLDALASPVIEEVKKSMLVKNDYQALLLAHHHQRLHYLTEAEKQQLIQTTEKHAFQSIRLQVEETMQRYAKITPMVELALKKSMSAEEDTFTDKLDKVLTHKLWGSLIFFSILFVVFQAIFAWAEYPMNLIDDIFSALSAYFTSVLPEGVVASLLTEGIIPGIGGVVIFIPQIAILFGFIALLEEVGYMARAVFLSDNLMRKFGLNGRSMVSLFSGAACAIPAVMSTRTISNWKERLITIFVTPFISCSARIPVYTVLVAFVVPAEKFWGVFELQGLVVLGLYILGVVGALGSAYVMKKILKTGESSFFVMELPVYKTPQWKNTLITIWEKVKTFVVEAGKVILVISIVLWVLATYGPGDAMDKVAEQVKAHPEYSQLPKEELDNLIASKQLEVSYAGIFGKAIEPAIKPLGYDWKMGIALLTSFAAREVFVGTMATIYSIGSEEEDRVIEKIRKERNPETGELVYNAATAMSLLVFYVFAMQCMSTLAVVQRETKSWAWPALQLVYMTAVAYLSALLTFNIMS
ncbi:ferrous iron transport protein B [Rapidithrix thailandica]|uniref:Ferrous iron transport protein B n=1 Tax=Rapidithrix thailandica TaxID=413964 RepID=A0AAW9S1X6_9BACT